MAAASPLAAADDGPLRGPQTCCSNPTSGGVQSLTAAALLVELRDPRTRSKNHRDIALKELEPAPLSNILRRIRRLVWGSGKSKATNMPRPRGFDTRLGNPAANGL